MPDISMCSATNEQCRHRDRCYRATCTPDSHWQAYAAFYDNDAVRSGKWCPYFIAVVLPRRRRVTAP